MQELNENGCFELPILVQFRKGEGSSWYPPPLGKAFVSQSVEAH